MSRKLSQNKAQGLYSLYTRYLVTFSSYTAMGVFVGSLAALALRPSFRGFKFYSLLGASLMGGIATNQAVQEYQSTFQAYKKHNTNAKLFQGQPEKETLIEESIRYLDELKHKLTKS